MKNLKLIIAIVFLTGIVILFFQKDKITTNLSNAYARVNLGRDGISDSLLVYEEFNLEKSGSILQGSVLEFGAKNCSACRKMETVIEEIKLKYSDNISIKFINVTEYDGLVTGKQFGVVMIPMQVLLDNKGKVVYKHVGYIPTSELSSMIEKNILNN